MNERRPSTHPGEEGHYRDRRDKVFPQRPNKLLISLWTALVGVVIIAIILGVVAFRLVTAQPHSPMQPPRIATSSPTSMPTSLPSETPTLQPTSTPTLQTTPTPTISSTPQPAPPETLPKNIVLQCNCTDRVIVTITKIVVQPSQNRMLWSLTLYNNSQKNADALFYQFELQQGDQTNPPTSGEPTFDPTGNGMGPSSDVPLSSGQTQSVVLTFSFVPYTAMTYTLVSQLDDSFGQIDSDPLINFQPILISF